MKLPCPLSALSPPHPPPGTALWACTLSLHLPSFSLSLPFIYSALSVCILHVNMFGYVSVSKEAPG